MTTAFLHLPEREINNYAKPIKCSQKTLLLIRDNKKSLWTLYPNDTLKKIHNKTNTYLPRIYAPKIHHFNEKLLHYTDMHEPRASLLRLLGDTSDVLQTLDNIRDVRSNGFLHGLSNFIGTTVNALARGGSELVEAIGDSVKKDLEGSSTVIDSIGGAGGEIRRDTGDSLSKILMTISGPFLFGLCAFIIIYLSIQAFPNCKRYFAKRRKNMKAVEYQIDTEGISDISQPYNACQNINGEMCPFVDPKILEHEK